MELFRSKIKNFPENRILNILSIPNWNFEHELNFLENEIFKFYYNSTREENSKLFFHQILYSKLQFKNVIISNFLNYLPPFETSHTRIKKSFSKIFVTHQKSLDITAIFLLLDQLFLHIRLFYTHLFTILRLSTEAKRDTDVSSKFVLSKANVCIRM